MKEITKIVSGVVLTALVSSCGIYTQYKRPEVNTENLYRVEETQSDSVSIADLSWDDFHGYGPSKFDTGGITT